MSDNSDETFPYGMMAFLLVIIWLLSNFTTLLCITIIVLVLIIANITKNNDRKTVNQSDPNLQQSQVSEECLRKSTQLDAIPKSLVVPSDSCPPITNTESQYKSIRTFLEQLSFVLTELTNN